MRPCLRVLLVSCAVSLAPAVAPVRGENLQPATGALLQVRDPSAWNAGLRLQFDRRQFQSDTGRLDFDGNHALVRVGRRLAPPLHFWAEAGVAQASTPDEDSESGFEWAVGSGLRLWELRLAGPDPLPRKETVALEVEAAWRSVESNFGDADFTRDEWRVSPFVEYALDRRAELRWWPVDPDAVRIRGGVVFARADGDFGGAALEQNRDFALLLGAGALWAGGWTLDVAAALFGGEEREFSLGIHRIF